MSQSWLLMSAALIVALSCQTRPGASMTVDVELDAFSGRPNPRFTVTGGDATEVRQKMANLPKADRKMPDVGLGFRGFVVHLPRGTKPLPEDRVRVFSGLIESGGQVYRDVHELESLLRDKATAAGYSEIVN
jgi:hypothetical protein